MRRRSFDLTVKAVGICIAAVLILTACSAKSGSAPTGPAGGTVTGRLVGLWTTLDPQVQGTTDNTQIDQAVYDWLVAFDGNKIVPYLASSWQQTPTSVKFTLRKDATCGDGTSVTPSVVANSFRRLMFTNASSLGTVRTSFGPPPYTISPDDSAGTITIGVGKPYSGLLLAFSQVVSIAAIVCPRGLSNPSSLATTPDGSGPFKLASAVQGDSVTLVARPDWHWGPNGLSTKSAGFPQTMVYRIISNETTAANLLLTGGLDIAIVTGPDNARLIPDKTLIHKPAHGFYASLITYNETAGRPTADQALRQALSTSIDTKAFGQAAYNGYLTLSSSFLTPNAQCFDPATKNLIPAMDIAKAKQIMSAAGYQAGSDGFWQDKNHKTIVLNVAGGLNQGNGPEYMAAQFTSAGFNVKLNKSDRGTYSQAYLTGNFDVAISELASAVPDPNGTGYIAFFTGPPPPTGSNASRMDYPSIDAEIDAANASSGAESCKQWSKVQQELLTRYIVLPTGAPQYQWYSRGIDYPALPRVISPMFLKRVK